MDAAELKLLIVDMWDVFFRPAFVKPPFHHVRLSFPSGFHVAYRFSRRSSQHTCANPPSGGSHRKSNGMAPKQRIQVANQHFSKNVQTRGNIPKTLKPTGDKLPAAPWLIGLFIFVVCGSAIFEIVRYVKFG